MDFEKEPEQEPEFIAEDIIALYLFEHPEDEEEFLTATTLAGTEHELMSNEVAIRLGKWGIERGYFHIPSG